MLPLEGPFPQWDTPRVRWGTGSSTTIEPLVPEGRYVLRIMGQTHSQDQVMTLQLDGSEIGVLPFARTHDWEPLELPVNLGPGSHRLTLLYTKSNPGPDASRSVLFRGLSLVPVHAMESNPANYPPDAVRP
jgi:hypothetical protein